MGAEQRKTVRRRFSQYAMLYTADGKAIGRCVIRDISDGGAKLSVAAATDVPDEFVLVLSQSGSIRRKCRAVWRSERAIGVAFEPRKVPAL
jgi:hypothetical protein